MQNAIHGPAVIAGNPVYAVVHDGAVTVYSGDQPVSIALSDSGPVEWSAQIAVDRVALAHQTGRRWEPPGHSGPSDRADTKAQMRR